MFYTVSPAALLTRFVSALVLICSRTFFRMGTPDATDLAVLLVFPEQRPLELSLLPPLQE